jgi:2-keto-4-pentenoate hydratase/2-oxohepta-3-ene-1,7-dioic acid hydratase in catechol pathway
MRVIRFERDGRVQYGLVEGDTVFRAIGSPFADEFAQGAVAGALDHLKILAPCAPTKIICAAKNFPWGERPAKSPRPLLFYKPLSALIGHQDDIVYPVQSQRLIVEAELVVVIGKAARNVRAEDAAEYILGYTCGNDVTAYDLVLRDNTTFDGKSFDTFCPLGPFIVTDFDPEKATIACRINGKAVVSGAFSERYYGCADLVSYISAIMTLVPGDVIFTGTPDIGTLQRGDTVEVDISGIGTLRNRVV